MLTRNSEIVVYIKKMLNKLTSSVTRKTPWFEQFEHVFLFQFIQVIDQEVNLHKKQIFIPAWPSGLLSRFLFVYTVSAMDQKKRNLVYYCWYT